MASSKENKSYKDAVDSAMTSVSERYPEQYKSVMRSDSSNEMKIRKEAEKHVDEIMKVINNVRCKSLKSKDALSHLSDGRKARFMSALNMKTFEMKIKEVDGISKVEVTRGGKPIRQTMNLSTVDEVNTASIRQTASIVIECVILVLEVIGVDIPDDDDEVDKAIDIAIKFLEKSEALAGDIDELQEAAKNGDTFRMAKAIFKLVIDIFEEGLFWDITKALLSDMA